ncbi:MAG TPA: hypothetical protein VLG50_00195 [Candidatus Saccharimonadales bacterium]|nr:hypothetical protein [Candidatus Saccharimonadales bacterium]
MKYALIKKITFLLSLTVCCIQADEISKNNKTFKETVFENKYKIMGGTAGFLITMPFFDSLPASIVDHMGAGLNRMDVATDKITRFAALVVKVSYRSALFGIPACIGYKLCSKIDEK